MSESYMAFIHNLSSSVDVFDLVKKFQQFQHERAYVYHLFNEGHKIYLGTAPTYDFAKFRVLVNDVTQRFKRISEDIIAIENRLRNDFGAGYFADYIASVQEAEKHNLELTAKLQLAKQGVVDYAEEPEREIKVLDLQQRLRRVEEQINGHLEEIRYEAADL